MGGLSSLFGGETSQQRKAKRESRAAAAIEQLKASKLKKEEALASQAKGKRRVKAAGRRRRVFTSPLGLGDGGTNTLA